MSGYSQQAIPDIVMRFEDVTCDYSFDSAKAGCPLGDEDLGPKFGEVRSRYRSRMIPGYTVKGYNTFFGDPPRRWQVGRMNVALSNPKAKEGSDLLDIGGKVSCISITGWEDAGRGYYHK